MRKEFLYKNFTVYRISDLQFNYPYLEWDRFFNIITGHQLDKSTTVQVYFSSYLSSLFDELKQYPTWYVLKTLISLFLLVPFFRQISNALIAMYAHNLYENLVTPQAKHTREDYCIKLTSNLFNDISSNLYLKAWPSSHIDESQKILTKVFNFLKDKLKTAFQGAEWLDDDSQVHVQAKLAKMRLTFNKLEDPYNSEQYLNIKYSGLNINPGSFINNVLTMFQTHSRKRFNLQGKTFNSIDL